MTIENVYIYVADSLRWDFLPDSIADRGVTFKTVAQSNFSAPSFATLGSGLYPPQHGVHNWGDVLAPETQTIFEIDDLNGGYRDHSDGTDDPTFRILKREEAVDVTDLNPPFIHLERNSDPHVPFGEDAPETAAEYYADRGNDWQQMHSDYRHGIAKSVSRFERRLDALAEAGVLDETLVIFTSDHGELLGEYGKTAHGSPSCPELAYVPCVFIHPEISASSFHANPKSDVIEHVDVIQTALAAIEREDALSIPGTNLFEQERHRDWGYNHINAVRRDRQLYTAEGIWWYDSGHVFTRNSMLNRGVYALAQLRGIPERRHALSHPLELIRAFTRSHASFGEPPVGKTASQKRIKDFRDTLESRELAHSRGLDKTERERLVDLGYLS